MHANRSPRPLTRPLALEQSCLVHRPAHESKETCRRHQREQDQYDAKPTGPGYLERASPVQLPPETRYHSNPSVPVADRAVGATTPTAKPGRQAGLLTCFSLAWYMGFAHPFFPASIHPLTAFFLIQFPAAVGSSCWSASPAEETDSSASHPPQASLTSRGTDAHVCTSKRSWGPFCRRRIGGPASLTVSCVCMHIGALHERRHVGR